VIFRYIIFTINLCQRNIQQDCFILTKIKEVELSMEKYSDEELEQIHDKLDQWFTEFSDSPFFEELTEEQKEESGSIISTFTEYMYNYHSRPPEAWNERTLETCCLKTLPSKINADEHFFKSIAPVLSSFFDFTERAGLLKKSSNLAKRVKKIDKQIVINSNDPSNWGMAKSFVMSAQKSGVNIENQKELNEYMIVYNSRQIQSRQAQSQLIQSKKLPTTKSKIGRNEPCPCGSGKKYKKCCGR